METVSLGKEMSGRVARESASNDQYCNLDQNEKTTNKNESSEHEKESFLPDEHHCSLDKHENTTTKNAASSGREREGDTNEHHSRLDDNDPNTTNKPKLKPKSAPVTKFQRPTPSGHPGSDPDKNKRSGCDGGSALNEDHCNLDRNENTGNKNEDFENKIDNLRQDQECYSGGPGVINRPEDTKNKNGSCEKKIDNLQLDRARCSEKQEGINKPEDTTHKNRCVESTSDNLRLDPEGYSDEPEVLNRPDGTTNQQGGCENTTDNARLDQERDSDEPEAINRPEVKIPQKKRVTFHLDVLGGAGGGAIVNGGTITNDQIGESSNQTYTRTPHNIYFLPEWVWVRVMTQLGLGERYRMSVTCWLFYRLFSDPSLWRSAVLTCGTIQAKTVSSSSLVGLRPYSSARRCGLSKRHTAMILRFGHVFRHVDLRLPLCFTGMTSDAVHTLSDLLGKDQLRSLTLTFDFSRPLSRALLKQGTVLEHCGLRVVLDNLKNARSLEQLTVASWCLPDTVTRGTPQCDVVEVLEEAAVNTFPGLQSLSVAWSVRSARRAGLRAELDPAHASPATALRLVTSFRRLQRLEVLHAMLSQELLQELATAADGGRSSRASLLSLDIVQRCGKDTERQSPDLAASAWTALTSACPRLRVTLDTDVSRVSSLAWLLRTPAVPLVGVRARRLRRRHLAKLFRQLQENFKASLRSLHCVVVAVVADDGVCAGVTTTAATSTVEEEDLAHDSFFGPALVELVSACRRLRGLVICGVLSERTVARLQRLRKTRWNAFRVRQRGGDCVCQLPFRGNDDLDEEWDVSERDSDHSIV